jgi:RiboL-PSP-HEPN
MEATCMDIIYKERMEKEPEETCLYKRLKMDYNYGLGRIYTKEEIVALCGRIPLLVYLTTRATTSYKVGSILSPRCPGKAGERVLDMILETGLTDNHPYRTVKRLSENEVKPILDLLTSDKIDEIAKQSLRKYLINLLISALEHFFKNEARLLVDNNDMRTSDIFESKLSFTVDDLGELLKGKKLTKGIVVASSFNFMDLDEMNGLFSNLLKRKFLHYIKMLNDIDQTWQMSRGPPVPLDYGKLREAYALRHQIIHELNDPHVTKTRIHGLWENALNIMEIADSVFSSVGNPKEMEFYDQEYEGA